MFKEALGHTIRLERNQRSLNLRDVANKAYVALGYLSEIERGHKDASSLIIDRISHALGLPTSDLLYETALNMQKLEQHRMEIEQLERELSNV